MQGHCYSVLSTIMKSVEIQRALTPVSKFVFICDTKDWIHIKAYYAFFVEVKKNRAVVSTRPSEDNLRNF
jgi:hypothetical protein